MKTSTRSLALGLAAGALALGLAGVTLPSAFAQDGAATPPAGDPLADFTLPEPEPAHDYASGADAAGFTSLAERVSYAIGLNIGTGLSREFAQMDATLDADAVSSGLGTVVRGDEAKLSEAQVVSTLQGFQQQMMEKQIAAAQQAAEKNQRAASAFFENNAVVEGVQTTDSGLQYKFEEAGEGPTPTADDEVTLNYRGTLLDGTEFDSSYGNPEPAKFRAGQVISGFSEALLLMPVGSKGKIWIPSELAYGQNPPPNSVIEPGSPLVFELEILGLNGSEPQPGAEAAGSGAATPGGAGAGTGRGGRPDGAPPRPRRRVRNRSRTTWSFRIRTRGAARASASG